MARDDGVSREQQWHIELSDGLDVLRFLGCCVRLGVFSG